MFSGNAPERETSFRTHSAPFYRFTTAGAERSLPPSSSTSVTPAKARTSCQVSAEPAERAPWGPPPRPRSQSFAKQHLRRITCLQRNLPMGSGARARDARRPMPDVRVPGSWLLGDSSRGGTAAARLFPLEVAVEASDPCCALGSAHTCQGDSSCRLFSGGIPGSGPHPLATWRLDLGRPSTRG